MNKNGSTHCKAISGTFVCIGNNDVKVILILHTARSENDGGQINKA